MARAALVGFLLAAATGLSASGAAQARTAPPATYVVRGVVVQYIPPSGSVVGSLSIRVVSTGGRGHELVGELVTVAVGSATGSKLQQLSLSGSLLTLTLRATSAGSILKGAGVLQTMTGIGPAPGSNGSSTPAGGTPSGNHQDDDNSGSGRSTPSGGGDQSKPQSGGGDQNGSGDHSSGSSQQGGSSGGGDGGGHGNQSGSGKSDGHK